MVRANFRLMALLGLGFLFLADSSRILPVRIHEAGIEVNANENLIDSTELAKTLSDHKPSKTRHSKFSLEETLRQLIDLGSDLPKDDHAMDVFHIARRYGIETLLDFDAMLIKVAAIASREEREKVVLPLANWWLPRDSGKWNAMLDLSKDPLVRGEVMYLAANHSDYSSRRKGMAT